MTRILVTVMPFAGHVAPITGVVGELLARGHDVTVYTGSRYVDRFASLGAAVVPWSAAQDFDENKLVDTFPQLTRRGPAGLLASVEFVFIRTAVGQAKDIMAAHAEQPFELIVGDILSVGAGLTAELAGLPWATLSVVPLIVPSEFLPPPGLALQPARGWPGRQRDRFLRMLRRGISAPLDRAIGEVRTEVGLPPSGTGFDLTLLSPDLIIATGTESIEYPRPDFPPQLRFVGRIAPAVAVSRQLPDWWADAAASDLPIVLVTQGTLNIDPTELVMPTLQALADEPVLVVATTAGVPLGVPVPSNARVADFLNFDVVLARASVMVTNGGWGGVLQGLAAGVPLVVAGSDLDKPEIAARVAWAGAGINLHTGKPKPAKVAAAVRQALSSPVYRERARVIAADLAAAGGAGAAVDLIEGLVGRG